MAAMTMRWNVQTPVCSQTNAVVSIADNLDTTFTITFQGTPQAQYYVVAGPDTAGIGQLDSRAGQHQQRGRRQRPLVFHPDQ